MLFTSLASSLKEDAIGIVALRTGNDGALGLKAIGEEGGVTLVRGTDGNGPQHDGMPGSAIATGAVDIIVAVEGMPGHRLALQDARQKPGVMTSLPVDQINAARRAIRTVLNRRLGHDFSGYKDKTVMRRIQRRMHVLVLPSRDTFVARLASLPEGLVSEDDRPLDLRSPFDRCGDGQISASQYERNGTACSFHFAQDAHARPFRFAYWRLLLPSRSE